MRREYSAGIIVYKNEIINKLPVRLYLLLYYPKGYWDLVKGHLDRGESSLEAAHRELMEETGLRATLNKDFKQVLEYMFKNSDGELVLKKVTFFLGEASAGDVQLSLEHDDYAWLPYEEAVETLTYKNAQQLLGVAESYLKKL